MKASIASRREIARLLREHSATGAGDWPRRVKGGDEAEPRGKPDLSNQGRRKDSHVGDVVP
jgi:hypothetical protein